MAQCRLYYPEAEPEIILHIIRVIHTKKFLIQTFKTALELMPRDEYEVLIREDKRPFGEHERRFNATAVNDVAIIINCGLGRLRTWR